MATIRMLDGTFRASLAQIWWSGWGPTVTAIGFIRTQRQSLLDSGDIRMRPWSIAGTTRWVGFSMLARHSTGALGIQSV